MNSSPPRLPRLGGHRSSPQRKPSPHATAPSGPLSNSPSARIEPARSSHSPERPYIDVGYDDEDDDVAFAQQPVPLLASLRGTTPSAPQRQAPSPPRPRRPSAASASPSLSSSSLNAVTQAWKAQIKNEVLPLGKTHPSPPSSPLPPSAAVNNNASAAASAEESSSSSVGEDEPASSASPFPAMPQVFSSTAESEAAAVPVIPIMTIPRSPVSVASSIATDTPRSILRHPGSAREARSPRSGRRRISFVDLSPLRDKSSSRSPEERRGPSDSDADDEYDFAEPMLRYPTDAPPATSGRAQRDRTPSPISSPERPVAAGSRSPTRSPPRKDDRVSAARAVASAVASAPPPPEEENDVVTLDVASPLRAQTQPPHKKRTSPLANRPQSTSASAAAAPAQQKQQQQQQQRPSSPPRQDPRNGEGSGGRGASNGRDEDVLTQPHNHSHRPGTTATASGSVHRRPPARQRWPSDAYVDEPPTEASVTQRNPRSGAGGHRESLDPEDDMGSTDSGSSDRSSSDFSDNGPSFHYETPVKPQTPPQQPPVQQGEERQSPRRSPRERTPSPRAASPSRSPPRRGSSSSTTPREQTKSPSQSSRHSPSGRLPERRTSGSRASSVVSSVHVGSTRSSNSSSGHRERPIPATPSSVMEEVNNSADRHHHRHRHRHSHSPPRDERTASSDHQSTLLPSPENDSSATQKGEAQHALPSREASYSGSHGRSPSTITERSSGQSFGEETAAAPPPPPVQRTSVLADASLSSVPVVERTSPVKAAAAAEEGSQSDDRHRHKHRHRKSSTHSSSGERSRHSSSHSRSASHNNSHSNSNSNSRLNSPQRYTQHAPQVSQPEQPEPTPVVVAKQTKKPKKKEEEPAVYVDPLLRERQHRHDVARQESPTHLTRHASPPPPQEEVMLNAPRPGATDAALRKPPQRHASRRSARKSGASQELAASLEPVSLRDIMTRHDSPAEKAKRPPTTTAVHVAPPPRSSAASAAKDVAPTATARNIFEEPRSSKRSSPAHSATSRRRRDEARSESSRASSGGVAAEDLVWDAPTPASRQSSVSPPASPASSSAALTTTTTTPGGHHHKVFRKKLVTVVRRRKSGAAPSEDDPVMQVSMVPYREGSPAVKRAEAQQQSLRQVRSASVASSETSTRRDAGSTMGALSTLKGTKKAPLDRLIDHIQPGRKSSVSSRRSTRDTHIREDRVGEVESRRSTSSTVGADGGGEVTPEERLEFRRALSVVSSRNASRRSSVAPSAVSRRSRSGSLRRSPPQPLVESEKKVHDVAAAVPHSQRSSRRNSSSDSDHASKEATASVKPTPRKSSAERTKTSSPEKKTRSRSSSVLSEQHRPAVDSVKKEKRDASQEPALRRKDEATMTPSRHRHRHSSSRRNSQRAPSRSSATPPQQDDQRHQHRHRHRRRSSGSVHSVPSAKVSDQHRTALPVPPQPKLPDAPYRATQNDEFYGATLSKEVAQLKQDAVPRMGITKVTMPQLLPRLALESDGNGQNPRGNTDANDGGAAWSVGSSEENDGAEGRLAIDDVPPLRVSGSGNRVSRLLQSNATQTGRSRSEAMLEWQGGGSSNALAFDQAPAILRAPMAAAAAFNAPPSHLVQMRETQLAPADSVQQQQQQPSSAPQEQAMQSVAGTVGRMASAPPQQSGASDALNEAEMETPASFVKRGGSAGPGVGQPARTRTRTRSGSALKPARLNATSGAVPAASPYLRMADQSALATPYSVQPMRAAPVMGGNNVIAAAAAPPVMPAAAPGVPLFVPPLTVDNVSHLTSDWQSTLRERSGKAKQNAMEQFLIASAEAGAASTLNGSYADPVAQRGMAGSHYATAPLTTSVPMNPYGAFAVSGATASAPPSWQSPTQWPTQTQPGLPANEFYGQLQSPQQQQQVMPISAVATTTPPLASHASPPRLLPQAFWEAEREARAEDARAAAVAKAAVQKAKATSSPATTSKRNASAAAAAVKQTVRAVPASETAKITANGASREKSGNVDGRGRGQRPAPASSPDADAFELVEASSVDEAAKMGANSDSSSNSNSSSSRSGGDNASEAVVVDAAVEPLSQPRSRATRSLAPPTAAPDALSKPSHRSDHTPKARGASQHPVVLSPELDSVKAKDKKERKREEQASRRKAGAATAAAIATAAKGHVKTASTAKPEPFTITEPATEPLRSQSTRAKEKRSSRHESTSEARRRLRGRSRSTRRPASSSPSLSSVASSSSSSISSHHPRSRTKEQSKKEKLRAKQASDERATKNKKKEKEASRRHSSHRHDKAHNDDHSHAATPAEASFSIPDVFDLSKYKLGRHGSSSSHNNSSDSDVDSDRAMSMEFQLSRLMQQRERDVSVALSVLQQEREKAELKKLRRAEKAARKAQEKEEEALRRQRREKEKKKEERKASRHRHRSSSSEKKDAGKKGKEKTKKEEDDHKKKKREKESKKHRSPSLASAAAAVKEEKKKKSKKGKDEKDKARRHTRRRSASASQPELLPPPPPPRSAYALPGGAAETDADVAGRVVNDLPSYAPFPSTYGSSYAPRDYHPANTSFRSAARDVDDPPLSAARSYYRSRSAGLDSEGGASARSRYSASPYSASPYSAYRRSDTADVDAASSRYQRHRAYTPSASSRWADTPRRSYDDINNNREDAASPSAFTPSYRRPSQAARPSTHWADYVRDAERSARTSPRDDAGSATSAPYSSYGSRRRSAGGADAYAPRPSASASAYTPSYTSRAADYDDIDDIPKRSYFNDDAPKATARRSSSPPPTAVPSYRSRRSRSNTTAPLSSSSTAAAAAAARAPRPTASTRRKRHDDDILVSTPSQDGEAGREASYDYWEPPASQTAPPARRGAPPPPPPPPLNDSTNGSTRAPSAAEQAFVGVGGDAKVLPIVTEHTVTDAQAAHDFAAGVKEIVSALRQYKERNS